MRAKHFIQVAAMVLVACLVAVATTQAGTISLSDVRNYWGAEDGSGTNVDDSIGNMDASLLGTTAPTFTTSSKVGDYAVQFTAGDGSGVMDASAAYSPQLTIDGFSFACWFRVDSSFTNYQRFLTTRGLGHDRGMNIQLIPITSSNPDDDTSTFGLNLNIEYAGLDVSSDVPDVITAGQWSLLTVTRSPWGGPGGATTAKVYLDGSPVLNVTTQGLTGGVENTLLVGNYRGYATIDREFPGAMDEMVLFNRELTADEVGEFYNLGGEVANIPEPSTLALLATGLIGLLCYAWRKRK